MILRALHLPAGMDSELTMLASITGQKKADIVRKFVASELGEAWDEIDCHGGIPSIIDREVSHHQVSSRALLVMEEHYKNLEQRQ